MGELDNTKKLRSAVDRILAKHNLTRQNFTIIPGEDDVPDRIDIFAKVEPEAFLSLQQKEQLEYDAKFAETIKSFTGPVVEKNPLEDKIEEARKLIEDWDDE